MQLERLVCSLPEHKVFGSTEIQILRINNNSRQTQRGDLFVAVKGLTHDSHKFIPPVVGSGAVAVVGERDWSESDLNGATYIQVKNGREALGLLASAWFDHPSRKLQVIGVTGTEGKTTTSNIIYHILETAGLSTGLISTINAKIAQRTYDTGLHTTNPEALPLQEFLAKMVDSDCRFAVLETTSIGIDQHRVTGVDYDIGVLTNITHDHLDYHQTLENYREAKAKMFRRVKTAILNKDDSSFNFMRLELQAGTRLVCYSILDCADFQAVGLEIFNGRSNFVVVSKEHRTEITTNLIGEHNVSNTLAAIAAVREYQVDWEAIQHALQTFQTPEGRLENVNKTGNFPVYVDFAHTPNSIEKVLTAIRQNHPGHRIIAVYGSAGGRDTFKRPEMGRIGAKLADIVIFTADDPRCEKPEDIIRSMVQGAEEAGAKRVYDFNRLNRSNAHVFAEVLERGEAIALAIALAKKGDVVAILGKGHEKSMPYGKIEYPWSDAEAVAIALSGGVKKIQRHNEYASIY